MFQRTACLVVATATVLLPGCTSGHGEAATGELQVKSNDRDEIAEGYVKLVLAVGQHDEDYVDAFYGPEVWREEAEAQALDLARIRASGKDLLARLAQVGDAGTEIDALRHDYLSKQLGSLLTRVDMLDGAKFDFDEESSALYDAVAPTYDPGHFRKILDELDGLLPGKGPLLERYGAFRDDFVIPPDRLDTVFEAALGACRTRTLQHIDLPEEESFTIEYVTDKPWSGYNWYQGGFRSLIQINTDFPIHIDRPIDLACHEGYPGHHVYNMLLEKNLVQDRGWIEFTVYPLFSSQSLIAEGTAEYGIQVAFPGTERVEFEREHLFPLAGLDASRADLYYTVLALREKLSYAGNEAARRYLNGEIDAEAAAQWLMDYQLTPPDRARQRVRFFDRYRAYVINYNLGQDIVRAYVESRAGHDADPARIWKEFGMLLSSPRLPSGLTE